MILKELKPFCDLRPHDRSVWKCGTRRVKYPVPKHRNINIGDSIDIKSTLAVKGLPGHGWERRSTCRRCSPTARGTNSARNSPAPASRTLAGTLPPLGPGHTYTQSPPLYGPVLSPVPSKSRTVIV